MTKQTKMIGPWVRRFLIEHLIGERNLAHNTQRSYRDTFCQLLPFVAKDANKAIDHLIVDDLSSERVRQFLTHIERQRHCGARTRNQRLAAIHAFARFVAERSPEHIAWCTGLRAVPFKRFDRALLHYLDKPEIDALIAAPDCTRLIGRRDHALLLFLYNTGARVSEAACVTIDDIESRPDGTGSVRLVGKGAKTRYCPLWPTTLDTHEDYDLSRQTNLDGQTIYQSKSTTADSLRNLLHCATPCQCNLGDIEICSEQTHRSAHNSAYNCHTSATRGCRY